MAAVTTISPILAKLQGRLDGYVKEAAKKTTVSGRQDLLAGITNGVAQLTKWGFGEYAAATKNPGKPHFWADAVAVFPATFQDKDGMAHQVAGIRLRRVFFDLFDKPPAKAGDPPITAKAGIDGAFDFVRALCGEESTKKAGIETLADLEIFCKQVELRGTAEAPGTRPVYFKFATSVRQARDRFDPVTKRMVKGTEGVWENWNGCKGLENWVLPVTQFKDGSGQVAAPSTNGAQVATTSADAFSRLEQHADAQAAAHDEAEQHADAQEPEATEPSETDQYSEHVGTEPTVEELIAIIEQGGNGASEANDQLIIIGASVGLTEEALDKAANWDEVRAMFASVSEAGTKQEQEGEGTTEQETEAAAPEPEPEPPPPPPTKKPTPPAKKPTPVAALPTVGSCWMRQPLDKNGKPMLGKNKKQVLPVEVSVTRIDAQAKTVDIKQADNPKVVIKGVPIAQLKPLKQ